MLKNRNNSTRLKGKSYKHLDLKKIHVGKNTYGTINVFMFSNKDEFLEIGNFCSIGPDYVFLTSSQHRMDTFHWNY